MITKGKKTKQEDNIYELLFRLSIAVAGYSLIIAYTSWHVGLGVFLVRLAAAGFK